MASIIVAKVTSASGVLKGALPKLLLGASLLGGAGSVLSAGAAKADPYDPGGAQFAAMLGPGNLGSFGVEITFSHDFVASPVNLACTFDANIQGNTFPTCKNSFGFITSNTDYLSDNLRHGSTFSYLIKASAINDFPEAFLATLNVALSPKCEDNKPACEQIIGTGTLIPITPLINVPGLTTRLVVARSGLEAVPAPLPLLGVGAAFGYSRKLKKRIKTSKSPEVMSAID